MKDRLNAAADSSTVAASDPQNSRVLRLVTLNLTMGGADSTEKVLSAPPIVVVSPEPARGVPLALRRLLLALTLFSQLTACLAQPVRLILQQCLDIGRGQRLINTVVFQRGDRDAQLARHLGPRVRALAAQFLQPFRGIVLQGHELVVAQRGVLKRLRCSGQVDAELLRSGHGLHRRTGLF